MARITQIICHECGQTKTECVGGNEWPKTCADCRTKLMAQKRAAHLKGLEALTVEERLAKIEKWIYDYKPRVNPMDITFG